jgi:FKBP-type peptidyl-prolyl cis-trans isomerase FkpA
MRKILIAAAAFGLTACQSSTGLDQRWAVPENISYAPELGVDLSQMARTNSGLYIQDLQVGTGPAAVAGNTIIVHYNGWLPDGTLFDSSYERNTPLQRMVGVGLLIRGWDEGLIGMQAGGRRKLVIRPSLAYGSNPPEGSLIPPLSTLIFEVEMRNVLP